MALDQGSGNLYVGYNVNAARDMNDKIISEYKKVAEVIKEEWPAVQTELQANWVGPDEQSFENEFAKKICTLYVNCHNLADICSKNIAALCNSWINFQKSNVLEGANTAEFGGLGEITLEAPEKAEEKIVEYKPVNFTESTSFGLTSESSATNISNKVDYYMENIKRRTSDLYNSIDPSRAFFGEQTATIKDYIAKVGSSMGNVLASVKDLKQTLTELAQNQYKKADTAVAAEMKSGTDKMDEDPSNTRWTQQVQ